jgi:dTMP kinase
MKNGKFIVIEGMDGSGKDTQAELLHEAMENSYLGFAPTRTGAIQKEIRKELSTTSMVTEEASETYLSFLMMSDRLFQTYNKENGIAKIINTGTNYISVRYSLSSKVYNNLKFHGHYDKLLKPDYLIFLDLDPETCLERINTRNKELDTPIERYENLEKLKHVRLDYLENIDVLKRLNQSKVLVIDGTKSIQELHNTIKDFINV